VSIDFAPIGTAGLDRFQELRGAAIDAVTERFYASYADDYAEFGQAGRDACREDLGYHLDFLRPVLEFGIVQPMVDYLRWLASVLVTRAVPAEHLPLSLDWLAEFFASHMQAPEAQIVVKALQYTKAEFLRADDAKPAIYDMMPSAWQESESFERALLAGDRKAARMLLEQCLQRGHNLIDAELHMIQPALYEIGHKWQNNQVTVAQEHLATAIAQSVMTFGLLQMEIPASSGRRVLLACVEGNNHAVGLQMVSDAFQMAGWQVQYLGANVPSSALIAQVRLFKPALLGLSVSFAQQLRVVKDLMSRLKESLGTERPAVIVGGMAINQFNRLAGEFGADGWSPNAAEAVTLAAKLAA
jgi:methanogenic corrinoid protein MtbC1